MKTGIELIAEARAKQIEKGYNLQYDSEINRHGQLQIGIWALSDPDLAICDISNFPGIWDNEICIKLTQKGPKEKLAIIGAWAAAELDRLNELNPDQSEGS